VRFRIGAREIRDVRTNDRGEASLRLPRRLRKDRRTFTATVRGSDYYLSSKDRVRRTR
jgi:hypothetical protein